MFFKKKKVILNCYTHNAQVYEFFKIERARKFIPDWWKSLPPSIQPENQFFPRSTMKGCVGFTNYYKNGFMIPLWSDLAIELDTVDTKKYRVKFSANNAVVHDTHQQFERGSYLPDYKHFKLISPWFLSCDDDIEWMWHKPEWNFDNPGQIIIPPAILDYKYQPVTNINMFVKFTNVQQRFIIKSGTPMVHLVPLTERDVEIKHHLVDINQYNLMFSKTAPRLSFLGKYRNIRRMINQQEENRCPFKFLRK